MDVKLTFLNNHIEEEFYVQKPIGFEEGKILTIHTYVKVYKT
jgi:hypothetical protein